MIDVPISNESGFALAPSQCVLIVRSVHDILQEHGVRHGEVSIAVVDDPTIHGLNRAHLNHDYPTDVLSFLLDRCDDLLEGEVVVSADTAQVNALDYQWNAWEELLLYVVHGTLHLVGYEDKSPHDAREMRRRETFFLKRLGVVRKFDQFDAGANANPNTNFDIGELPITSPKLSVNSSCEDTSP